MGRIEFPNSPIQKIHRPTQEHNTLFSLLPLEEQGLNQSQEQAFGDSAVSSQPGDLVLQSEEPRQSAARTNALADTQSTVVSDVEQIVLFQADAKPARQVAAHPMQLVPGEPLNTADLTQADLLQGIEIKETWVHIEGCQVINPPVVETWEEKKIKKKAWKCTFVTPPDLWNQVRDEWIQAVNENKKEITLLNKLKLKNGDMCTVNGVKTGERDEPMTIGEKQRRITYVHVTEIIPGIRGTNENANVVQPKARYSS